MTKLYVKFWLRFSKMPLSSLIYQSYLENKTNLLSTNSMLSWGIRKTIKETFLIMKNYNISNTA